MRFSRSVWPSIRKLLFWTHLSCGVLAGVVILVMSATGVLLTYQRQMTAWFDMRAYDAGPPSPGAARRPVETLVSRVAATTRSEGPMTVTVRSDPKAPASVAIGQKTVFVNAYTGDLLGEGAPGVRAFFRRVTDWHRWLGASTESRATGRMITGASNLAFFVIVASGPFLWWPKRFTWKQVRGIGWFRRGLPSKARDFNWHNTIGIWSAIPLLVIVGSGVVLSYPWANNLVYRLVGDQPPQPAAAPAGRPRANQDAADPAPVSLDVMLARAAEQHPAWRTIAVRWPLPPRGPVALTVDEGDGGQPQKRGTFTFDPKSGGAMSWEPAAGATPGRRARAWLRFSHTGEFYGLAGQTVAGLVSVGGMVLVWTGVALALRRFLSWRPRKTVDLPSAAMKGLESD